LKFSLLTIPIWDKLIRLPMEYWTPSCLSHVASVNGKPLFAYSVTEDQIRLGYARVMVEVNVNSEFLEKLSWKMMMVV